MDFVFPPPRRPAIAVHGDTARFPIRRIFCVGRNYAAHAREMGHDPDREPPFFFTKPADAIVADGEPVAYPPLTSNLHHEAELVIALGREGFEIAEDEALDYVYGYAIGNDLTRRDLQFEAREKGRPWDWAKAFDHSAICGPVRKASQTNHLSSGSIRLWVNDLICQAADLSDMIWSVPEIISILSHSVRIMPGDLVYTGTPAGVGALIPGDCCRIAIDGLGEIVNEITERNSH